MHRVSTLSGLKRVIIDHLKEYHKVRVPINKNPQKSATPTPECKFFSDNIFGITETLGKNTNSEELTAQRLTQNQQPLGLGWFRTTNLLILHSEINLI